MWSIITIFPILLLMVIVWWLVAARRIKGAAAGAFGISSIIYGNQHELPNHYLLPGRNYDNLMQQPALFMVLMLFVYQLQLNHIGMLVLAWVFVLGRYWHSFEHLRAQNIRLRTVAFALSSVSHWLLWLWVLVNVLYMHG
ncbi:MAPEG family protein [Salinibius halmophilus]|uniref:MAPEG family protein n=1 Tax=Salinibius halmophilus TaxID=1853216 RepID=UPI000E66D5C3|nr:MAPEG family protein [Salinibius halmophilus]